MELRETIEKISYNQRLVKQSIFESGDLHSKYKDLCEKKDSPLQRFYANSITRSVKINTCIQISNDQWHVEWQNTDYNHAIKETLTQKNYVSVLKISFDKSESSIDKLLENPIGLQIKEYEVIQKSL